MRQADGRAEVHEGLIQGTCCLTAWVIWRERFLDGTADGGLGDVLAALQHAHGDAQDVAVDSGQGQAEGNRADGAGRVAADARQLEQRRKIRGQLAAVLLADHAGGLLEVARPAVVAESLPEFHEELVVAAREALDVGQCLEEARVVGDDGRGARLLQHDLREPGVIRCDLLAPGQAAQRRLPLVPGKKRPHNRGEDLGMRQSYWQCFLFDVHDRKNPFYANGMREYWLCFIVA